MRKIFALLLMMTAGLAAPASASAQQQTSAADPPPIVEPTATVHGVVKDARTGAPIPNACIDVMGPSPLFTLATTCVGADGAYSLQLPVGPFSSVRVKARADGYRPMWLLNSADHVSGGLVLTASEDRTADFVLGGAVGTLKGSMVRQDGGPVRYPQLNLYPVGATKSVALIFGNYDGTYSRTDIPVGQYQVEYLIGDYGDRQWYPGAATRETAATVTINPDQPTILDEREMAKSYPPRPLELFAVSGVVTSGGQPVPNATVTVYNTRSDRSQLLTTDAGGRYRLEDLPSSCFYSISATAPGLNVVWAPNFVAPNPQCQIRGGYVYNLVIPTKVGVVRGSVRNFNNGALPLNTQVSLMANGYRVGRVPVRLDGTYEFSFVPPGSYQLMFTTSRYSMWHGTVNTAAESAPVSVVEGKATEVSDTLFAPSYIEFTLKDKNTGAPVNGACVTFNYASACSSADGVGLAGPMWIGLANLQAQIFSTPHYFHTSTPVTVDIGKVTRMELQLQPAAAVDIPVVQTGGQPFNGTLCVYAVQPRFGGAEAPAHCGSRNADGVVRVGPLPPGTVRLFIVPGGSDLYGAQWIGATGGSGQFEKAAPVELRTGVTSKAPQAKIDPSYEIWGHIVRQTPDGPVPVRGCATAPPVVARFQRCVDGSGQGYRFTGLGPYEWPIRFTADGYASERQLVPAGSLDANVALKREGRVTFAGPGWGGSQAVLTAFDAYTGEQLGVSQTNGFTIGGLTSGRIVVSHSSLVDGERRTCWLTKATRLFRFGTPYFSTTAGQDIYISGTLRCTQQEPLLLKPVEPGRRVPVTPETKTTTTTAVLQGKLMGRSAR